MKFIGIIPARYGSSRFPGKPLAMIGEYPVIQWVYQRCEKSGLDRVVVATDDARIEKIVRDFGGEVSMTSPEHVSGTDRCGEAAALLGLSDEDVIVNIQGDEPFIRSEDIDLLIRLFEDKDVKIATLYTPFRDKSLVDNPNHVKVIFTLQKRALCFSRYGLPYVREPGNRADFDYYKHIGIYAFKYKTLRELISLPESELEKAEKLEQMRWMENGYTIYLAESDYEGIGIDTPEDLRNANRLILSFQNPEKN